MQADQSERCITIGLSSPTIEVNTALIIKKKGTAAFLSGACPCGCLFLKGYPSSFYIQLVPNEVEQNVLRKAFQIHFQLLSLMDSCARGVKRCAANNFRILATQIQDTIVDLQPFTNACNPVVNEMVNKTLELFKLAP